VRTRRCAAAVAAVAAAATLCVALVANGGGPPEKGVLDSVVRHAKKAKRAFTSLTQAAVRVGAESLRIVIADDDVERTRGLRKRSDIGPYDGMLFAYRRSTSTGFTMSTVRVPLDIGFYDTRGRKLEQLRMEPCAGSETDCPLYVPSEPFTYALETLAGDLPAGRLRPARP
jgi:uncharacterized membrane protein (UPF0127 family)